MNESINQSWINPYPDWDHSEWSHGGRITLEWLSFPIHALAEILFIVVRVDRGVSNFNSGILISFYSRAPLWTGSRGDFFMERYVFGMMSVREFKLSCCLECRWRSFSSCGRSRRIFSWRLIKRTQTKQRAKLISKCLVINNNNKLLSIICTALQ